MNVGWVGLGKLGLTCALTLARHGHTVLGYDINSIPEDILIGKVRPPEEAEWNTLVTEEVLDRFAVTTLDILVECSDIVFVAVPTPHSEEYGGEKPSPWIRKDFEYQYLIDACRNVCNSAAKQHKDITLVVVSTVLPGTVDRVIRPLLNKHVKILYNPFFIAMGTTVPDFVKPEFVLVGADNPDDVEPLVNVYEQLHKQPIRVMSIPSAELAKVAYNTFISLKIVFANSLMEICHGTGADVDEVTGALAMAKQRVVSSKYLHAGMADGGACHPRDLIAMSWLAQRLNLSYDLLGEMVIARESQTSWLAELVKQWSVNSKLGVVVLGQSYKAESPLLYGSPAILLAHYLSSMGCTDLHVWEPFLTRDDPSVLPANLSVPKVFVIGTDHKEFFNIGYPRESVVIDPWGRTADQDGVMVVRVGRKR